MKEYFEKALEILTTAGFVRATLFIAVVYCLTTGDAFIGIALAVLWGRGEAMILQIDELECSRKQLWERIERREDEWQA